MGLWKKIAGLIGIPDYTSGTVKSVVIDANGTLSKKTINGLPTGTTNLSALSWDSSSSTWIERIKVWILKDRVYVTSTGETGGDMLSLNGLSGMAGNNIYIEKYNPGQYIQMRDGAAAGAPLAYQFSKTYADFWQTLIMREQKGIWFQEDVTNGGNYIELKAPDSISSSFTLKLPSADGTANQVMKTDGSGNLGWADAGGGFWDETISKATDKSVTSSTTLSDDSELQFSLDASSTYIGEIWIIWDRDTSGGDPYGKMDFAYTGTLTTGRYTVPSAITLTGSWTDFGTSSSSFQSDSANQYLKYDFIVETSTSGTFKVQWAQHISQTGASILRAGTTMSIKKVK